MNDMEFIEALKTKRNACGYSQSRLAKELHISRQNLNEIENGKTRASKEMKHTLLHYLDYCKCTQPFTLNIDYLRVRFPTTDALEIIKNVLAMKAEYFIHEDYGLFGYEELYRYGEIIVTASKDASMGVLLELKGMGCRHLEHVLQARKTGWYHFLSRCMDYEGIFKRLDLAVNDMGGLLDIEILRERYYADKVWKRSRKYEGVDSGKLSGAKGDTAKTFYIGSKNSPIYFCLYEKEKEQRNKGIQTDIKNRLEIRLKNEKAGQAVEELIFSRNPEQTIAKPMQESNYKSVLNGVVKKYNKSHEKTPLPRITPHSLRHTFCTQLAQKNMNPKNLQYIMGHASITITLDLYAHASEAGANREMRSLVA